MIKTVTEWLGYKKITEKKILKLRESLAKKSFICLTAGEYEKRKSEIDQRVEQIKSDSQSLHSLEKNYDKVKRAIQVFNATKEIEVAGKTMNIASALEIWTTRANIEKNRLSPLEHQVDILEDETIRLFDEYEEEQRRLADNLIQGNKSITEKDKQYVEELSSKMVPVILDPLNLKQKYSEERDYMNEFIEEINMKVNIANAVNNLEIELD